MTALMKWTQSLNWNILVLFCIIPGLAPFTPPHLYEKIVMLIQGNLVKAVDWFDLCFHGFPWVLALIKLLPFTFRK